MTYVLSIETDIGTYMHPYHLGTDLRVAKSVAEEIFHKRIPTIGLRIVSVALKRDQKLLHIYDGEWNIIP